MKIKNRLRSALALLTAVCLCISLASCSGPQQDVPGSATLTVRVADSTSAKTITPDGNVDISHYEITVHNDAENIHQKSGYLAKGSMFSVSNVPAGEWYATVDAYVDRGEEVYLKVASATSAPAQVAAGSNTTLIVTLDETSLDTENKSGNVTVTLQMPTALSTESMTFWYQYTITGLTNEGFTYTSGPGFTSGTDGTATITIDAETAGLVQGAYMFTITV